jgi:hypothetical protein
MAPLGLRGLAMAASRAGSISNPDQWDSAVDVHGPGFICKQIMAQNRQVAVIRKIKPAPATAANSHGGIP